MNETDYLRQQLGVERAHLSEILQAVRRERRAALRNARAVADYIDWAGRRQVAQLAAHRAALEAAPATEAALQSPLKRLSNAVQVCGADPGASPESKIENLVALLAAWSEALEAAAGNSLRVAHWRAAAGLSADLVLQERQLHAAARAALGLT